jgi:fido (protein-threonine AMPylation protein)
VPKQTEIPPIRPLEPVLRRAYDDAHLELKRAMETVSSHTASLFRALALEVMLHSLAGVRQAIVGTERPPPLPAPRAFLSPKEKARIAGTTAAFRHIDSRLGVVELGYEVRALQPETPYVLHALSEGRMDNPRETNPGMIRVIPTFAHYEKVRAVGAQADECRHLLDQTIELAATSSEPSVTRAGWLAFMIMTIHPFLDGNGRVARLLYLLVAHEGLPLGVDWGLPEQLVFHRGDYVRALKDHQGVDRYDIVQIDPMPFSVSITEWSIEGARLMRARLNLVQNIIQKLHDEAGSEAPELLMAVWLWRHTPAARIAEAFQQPHRQTLERLEVLRRAGMVERATLSPSRRVNGLKVGYRVVPDLDTLIREEILAYAK